MMPETETITVSLLGKKYQVSCGEEEVEVLEKSAKYLNKKMGEIRDSGRVVGLDRIALMAALNIIGESIMSEDTKEPKDIELETIPGEQISHSIPISNVLYLPEGHGKQSNNEVAARSKLNLPAGHFIQSS